MPKAIRLSIAQAMALVAAFGTCFALIRYSQYIFTHDWFVITFFATAMLVAAKMIQVLLPDQHLAPKTDRSCRDLKA
jgi:hypothetical protein